MKKYLFLLVLLTGLSLTLSRLGFGGFPFEGSWTATGGEEDFSWYLTYEFRGGEYSLEGYPPLEEHGDYSLLFVDDNNYTILLEPEGETPQILRFTMHEDGNLFMSGYSAMGGNKFGPNQ